mmetsp:Transcript_58272/g.92217  ORF Transcript_58272/g.92217 Transcript_58272/m.92217 type:complete len:200 (-) Transcript_58272:780-1379(-)
MEGTEDALAARSALLSFSLAVSTLSILLLSTSFTSANTLATSALQLALFCSWARICRARAYSSSGSCTDLAWSIASCSKLRSSNDGPSSPALLTFANWLAICCRASCLGASTFRISSASEITLPSTPASLACCSANFKAAISLDSWAFFRAASAASFDSAPRSSSSKGCISSSGSWQCLAAAMASRRALASLFWASRNC